MPHRAVAVYLYLETRADRERTCYPAIGTIARELHLSVHLVQGAGNGFDVLVDRGAGLVGA